MTEEARIVSHPQADEPARLVITNLDTLALRPEPMIHPDEAAHWAGCSWLQLLRVLVANLPPGANATCCGIGKLVPLRLELEHAHLSRIGTKGAVTKRKEAQARIGAAVLKTLAEMHADPRLFDPGNKPALVAAMRRNLSTQPEADGSRRRKLSDYELRRKVIPTARRMFNAEYPPSLPKRKYARKADAGR